MKEPLIWFAMILIAVFATWTLLDRNPQALAPHVYYCPVGSAYVEKLGVCLQGASEPLTEPDSSDRVRAQSEAT